MKKYTYSEALDLAKGYYAGNPIGLTEDERSVIELGWGDGFKYALRHLNDQSSEEVVLDSKVLYNSANIKNEIEPTRSTKYCLVKMEPDGSFSSVKIRDKVRRMVDDHILGLKDFIKDDDIYEFYKILISMLIDAEGVRVLTEIKSYLESKVYKSLIAPCEREAIQNILNWITKKQEHYETRE